MEVVEEEDKKVAIITTTLNLKIRLMMPSSLKNQTLNGKMYQVYKTLKIHSKKPSSYLLNFQKFSQEVENHGKVFFFMVHLEQEKPI